MSGWKNMLVMLGAVLSLSFISASVSVLLAAHQYSRLQFDLLNAVCGEVAEQEPEAAKVIAAVLKEYAGGNACSTAENDFLTALGYRASDFCDMDFGQNILYAGIGFLAGSILFILTFYCRRKMDAARISSLADYLEQVNMGSPAILSASMEVSMEVSLEVSSEASLEDDFSKLQDEIYKTVTFLYQTKDEAVCSRNNFAENLSNIAHQIKTPITAISLSVQMMKQSCISPHLEQIEKQLLRLTHLEEALLVLSRIDAGTLLLQKNNTDVLTMLMLAADNLQELFLSTGTSIEIPESGEMLITVDLEWTMEAVMNLMKNCMEHGKGGSVHCAYGQNPLYTEILIWDEGEGFAREDIPHLFERFYRGQHAGEGGIGIGLALAKEIIERQNGTIRAKNKLEGGALFEIRFYNH